jgi:ketosteroid isomerase-like protein
MRNIVYPFLIFSLLLLSCEGTKTSDKPSTEKETNLESEKEAVKDVLTQMWDAIEKEDVNRYATYVHPDFTQFGETDSILRTGKEVEVKGVRDWVATSSEIHTEMIDPLVIINGNAAWVVYYWSDHGLTKGEPFASKGKSTRIFVKENGKWLCIHGHYTLLP